MIKIKKKMKNNSFYLGDKSKFETIYNTLFPDGTNLDKINLKEKTVITFAGIPSSGKSTISKKIEQRYGGVRVDGDEIMRAISEKGLTKTIDENEEMKGKFTYALLKNSQFENKLVILDRSIDREYNDFFKVCKENKWNYFIIQLEITKQEATKRFKKRNPDNLDNWLPRLDMWVKQHEKFKKKIKSNISLDGTNPDLKTLFKKLNKPSE
mgnify:CR=1 FL=1